jgi:hypothetical protein
MPYPKKNKRQKDTPDYTPLAVAIAALVAVAVIQAAEIIFGNMRNSDAPNGQDIPMWRTHMCSACAGSIGFVISLFWLELLGRKSKSIALRSVLPWIPLVALTGLSAVIRIPISAVLLAGAIYCVWAYRQTCAGR